ncbi:HEAT repeat domain-containing protein [Polaribacter sp. OB-PA-B3]
MNLKKYIQSNKAAFRDKKMSLEADRNFANLLESKFHKKKKIRSLVIKYVSIAACFSIVFFSVLWIKKSVTVKDDTKNLIANLENKSPGKRLESIYKFNDVYKKEDKIIIDKLINILVNDKNVNVRIASIDALLMFPSNEKIRQNLIAALGRDESPLVQIKLIKAVSLLRENRAKEPLKKLINNNETFPIVKSNATLAMVKLKN